MLTRPRLELWKQHALLLCQASLDIDGLHAHNISFLDNAKVQNISKV